MHIFKYPPYSRCCAQFADGSFIAESDIYYSYSNDFMVVYIIQSSKLSCIQREGGRWSTFCYMIIPYCCCFFCWSLNCDSSPTFGGISFFSFRLFYRKLSASAGGEFLSEIYTLKWTTLSWRGMKVDMSSERQHFFSTSKIMKMLI